MSPAKQKNVCLSEDELTQAFDEESHSQLVPKLYLGIQCVTKGDFRNEQKK